MLLHDLLRGPERPGAGQPARRGPDDRASLSACRRHLVHQLRRQPRGRELQWLRQCCSREPLQRVRVLRLHARPGRARGSQARGAAAAASVRGVPLTRLPLVSARAAPLRLPAWRRQRKTVCERDARPDVRRRQRLRLLRRPQVFRRSAPVSLWLHCRV